MNPAGAVARISHELPLRQQVEGLLREGALSVVFHPVMRLDGGPMLATEALARMNTEPARSPREWFDHAAEVGLLTELDILALGRALSWLDRIPEDAFLFVNASPHTLVAPEFAGVIPADKAERLIIDISVDEAIPSYTKLVEAVRGLRESGARISIDDSSDDRGTWARVNKLEPDVIKLGPSITRNLLADPRARIVARHFLAFAADVHADVIAEAVETEAERDALLDLGVKYGQGFLWGRPAPL